VRNEEEILILSIDTAGGEPQGLQCYFKPDVYMYVQGQETAHLDVALKVLHSADMRHFLDCLFAEPIPQITLLLIQSQTDLPNDFDKYGILQFRNLISDFGVLIAIVSLTLITYLIGLEVPSLKMPASIRVSALSC